MDNAANPANINWFSMIHWLDPAILCLLICSILSVATAIERLIHYRNADIDAGAFMDRIRDLLRHGKVPEAMDLAQATPGPVAAVVKAGILSIGRDKEEIKDAIDRVRLRQGAFLDKHLPILGTVGSTAPFIGLFGTVIGIMRAFHDIGQANSAGTAVVATGIAEALIATAGGLMVAIFAVILYNIYVNWSGNFAVEMEAAGNEMVHLATSETVVAAPLIR